ncbi:hypothetical protein PaG_00890 [Moesziomyces aphidis]|uniref:Uncharacterized protein n=1 Tax=Moesziomyces aphidis TaxID=84754 RepID=W3VTU9_MOEAP|nr:hypothetical protein PaG_00890 [Moesziomyces aphidis]
MLTAVDAPVSRIELAFGGSRKLFSTSSGDPVERAVSILHEHLEPAKPCDVTCGGPSGAYIGKPKHASGRKSSETFSAPVARLGTSASAPVPLAK